MQANTSLNGSYIELKQVNESNYLLCAAFGKYEVKIEGGYVTIKKPSTIESEAVKIPSNEFFDQQSDIRSYANVSVHERALHSISEEFHTKYAQLNNT
ncbi:hypothetical protein AAOGI_06720 [Agarivorans albus]